ncbi:MAG: hypothetical protein KBT27_12025 [Prevotellaceae bacterium]|nr:hypothetical protein [Candidatus Faecinaster equi]
MRLPKNLLDGTYGAPSVLLCETDKTPIASIDAIGLKGTFKFNSYSEISFEVSRTYIDMLTGETKIYPYYDKIEALRLVYLPEFGYFQIQDPEIEGNGIHEKKSINAYSLEYELSQKYLELFTINDGTHGSVDEVVLYNPDNKDKSLLHLILEKAYGWKIGHIDSSLVKIARGFDIDRTSIYDFLMNEISDKFNCIVVFDTFKNTINIYAESLVETFPGDGKTTTFILSHPFITIGYIAIDGYKTNAYTYNSATGEIVFDTAPKAKQIIEVVDGYQERWDTDVFISFNNLAQQMNVSYSADDIKTVLTVTGDDDIDIRLVNMGLPYIVDLSYYYTVDWMGQDLYDAYTAYLIKCNQYAENDLAFRTQLNAVNDSISELKNRISTQYAKASVTADTIGTYYLRSGSPSNYYYTEVTLPADYNANNTYYKINGVNLTKTKLENLSEALIKYFKDGVLESDDKTEITLSSIAEQFAFVEGYSISNLITDLLDDITDEDKERFVNVFMNQLWDQYGLNMLDKIAIPTYNNLVTVSADAGYSDIYSTNYSRYYVHHLCLESATAAKNEREAQLSVLEDQKKSLEAGLGDIGDELAMNNPNNFTEAQLIRLSPFLREDVYSDNSIVITDGDSDSERLKCFEELKQCGQIELSKLCEPKLSFKADMANIYALPEFEPIIHQFQLGNLVRVALRPDYIKRSRLMKVDINFEKLDDFSCEFGDLTSARSASDIHADLLAEAVSAGKSVASNASYWNKGADKSNSIDIKMQQGLLDAITSIKSIDGTQGVEIDKYGIHLRKLAEGSATEYDPEQIWMVNNKILFTDDNFQTTKTVLGKFEYDGQERYGLIADAVVSGYIAGSAIEGGTIKIGDRGDGTYNFEVDQYGNVTMRGGDSSSSSTSYDLYQTIIDNKNTVDEIQSQKMYRVEVKIVRGQNIFTSTNEDHDEAELRCYVYSWGEDITSKIPAGSFNWKRDSQNPIDDEQWNQKHVVNNGPSITITDEDVTTNATFYCDVNILD